MRENANKKNFEYEHISRSERKAESSAKKRLTDSTLTDLEDLEIWIQNRKLSFDKSVLSSIKTSNLWSPGSQSRRLEIIISLNI